MLQGGKEEHNPHSHASTFYMSSQVSNSQMIHKKKNVPFCWPTATSIQIKVLCNFSLIYILYMLWPITRGHLFFNLPQIREPFRTSDYMKC
jgi:hypothetical protein